MDQKERKRNVKIGGGIASGGHYLQRNVPHEV